MPRYFFDLTKADSEFPDDDGIDLNSRSEAQSQAVRALVDAAREELPDGFSLQLSIRVRDEQGPFFEASLVFTSQAIGLPD